MVDRVTVIGRCSQVGSSLGAALQAGGLEAHEQSSLPPPGAPVGAPCGASVLVTLTPDARRAVETARDFAAADAGGLSRLVVLVRPIARKEDWRACRDAAVLTAFTRYSALALAAQDVRVNGLELGDGLMDQDIADAILALWRWPSITGQTLRLDLS